MLIPCRRTRSLAAARSAIVKLVGARCRLCAYPFIYATVGKLQLTSCPLCASERIASGCLTASLQLAMALGELERITQSVKESDAAAI
jgi:hypothetical protein